MASPMRYKEPQHSTAPSAASRAEAEAALNRMEAEINERVLGK